MKRGSEKTVELLPCGRSAPIRSTARSEAQIAQWQAQLRSYLHHNSLKYTEQRWMIAKLILETGGHLDAPDLVQKVKKKYPAIGAATVYRNIKVLCDAGLLEPSHQDLKGRVLYELPDSDHHDHIVCLDCGAIFEFHDAGIEKLQENVTSDMGFEPEKHLHVIHARCNKLQR